MVTAQKPQRGGEVASEARSKAATLLLLEGRLKSVEGSDANT